ncbi:MAG: histidine ammonia-lyase [Anaerolineaceae bacterium]|nr:histidine ammonia-lyase [Anaerolineaceae bacterium]
MVNIDGYHLTLENVVNVARYAENVSLSDAGWQAIQRSNDWLNSLVNSDQPYYGINTGFGIFADKRIPLEDSARLSRNLILSHAVGSGPELPGEVVRAAMLVRANTLAKGFSGVRVQVVQILLDMLNKGVTPIVPAQGSLGSSGDLCPLSHMALVLTTDETDRDEDSGYAYYQGQMMTGKSAMQVAGIARVSLGPKEGLALNNGATFSAAIAALAVIDAFYLLNIANSGAAMSLEISLGCPDAFDPKIQEVRGQPGQIKVADQIRKQIEQSTLVGSSCSVQDAYSIRCAPQVHGAVFDTIQFVSGVIQRDINAATDNPLLFGPEKAYSGGNFHGEPIGMAMDFLSIAISELAAISERRIFRLMDEKLNKGLPPMLVDNKESAGLNSGMMMLQYTAAALVLENQTLATPDSVHSLPTSAEQEDHNANSMTAARHARQIIENTAQVLAIELYAGTRALDLRLRLVPSLHPGEGIKKIYERIRQVVPYLAGDALWITELQKIRALIDLKELDV